MRDTDGVGVGLEVVHGNGNGEVRREEKAEAAEDPSMCQKLNQ